MAVVKISRRNDLWQQTATINFPFDEEELANALVEIGCPLAEAGDLKYNIDFHTGERNYYTEHMVDIFGTTSNSLLHLNMVALYIVNETWAFDKAEFYLDEINSNLSLLSFASVLSQVEGSNICDYENPGGGAYASLGREMWYLDDSVNVPDYYEEYVAFDGIGRDVADSYYFNEEFYVDVYNVDIDPEYYDDFNEFGTTENIWDDEDLERYYKEAESANDDPIEIKSVTDEILEFLEVSA